MLCVLTRFLALALKILSQWRARNQCMRNSLFSHCTDAQQAILSANDNIVVNMRVHGVGKAPRRLKGHVVGINVRRGTIA